MPRPSNPSPAFWVFCKGLQLAPDVTRRFWQALDGPEGPSCLYGLGSMQRVAVLYPRSFRDHVAPITDGPCSPHRIVELLEALVDGGKLSRSDANVVETAVLDRTGRQGAWR